LRWLYKSLSEPGVNELLHLTITLVNSSSEKGAQFDGGAKLISTRISSSMQQCWAILKDE